MSWRQGHKLECQQWQDRNMDFPVGGLLVTVSLQLRSLYDNSRTYTENDEEPLCSDDIFDLPNDWSSMTSDPSQYPEAERKLSHSDLRVSGRVKRESLKDGGSMAWGFDETVCNSVEVDASLKVGSLQHKFRTGTIGPSSEIHRRYDRNIPTYSHPSSNHTVCNKDFKRFKILLPYEDLVKLFQCEIWDISPRGLINCGNSCYANVVLQCLSCTKPLMVYLLQRSHTRPYRVRDWCLMCELAQHVSMLREGRLYKCSIVGS